MSKAILFAILATLVASCSGSAPDGGFQTIGPKAEPLRSAFEASRGKVRAILLVSPT